MEAPQFVQGVTADTGHWNFSDCILAQFAMEFEVYLNPLNLNETTSFPVPTTAKVNANASHCGDTNQTLNLFWDEKSGNQTLNRSMEITFSERPNDAYYGVSRLFAHFSLPSQTTKGVDESSYLIIDSGDLTNLMFHTPLDRSFLCADIGDLRVKTSLYKGTSPPRELNSTSIVGKSVQFDAFRTSDRVPTGFRTPMDCDYMPNDIVPIAVGVALALLVVVVLVAYLVGRKRHRQRGYQSL